MEIAKNAVFEKEKLVLKGLVDKKLIDLVKKKLGYECSINEEYLEIYVNSASKAREVYKEVAKLIMRTSYIEKLGFRFCDVLGYSFLIYLSEYRDGIENEVNKNPLSEEMDIVTLPDQNGYYYSTLYGIDNINVPAILTLGNLFASELSEIVERSLSLQELVELGEMSKKVLKLERFGDTTLARLARNFEKLSSIEEMLKKMIAVRSALLVDSVITGSVKYEEMQKVRRLGNGLCVYLSRKLRKHFEVIEGDMVSVKVIDGRVFLERI